MTTTAGSSFDYDVDAIKRKYAEERDKRLRPDGNDQYIEIAREYAKFRFDPRAEDVADREPIEAEVDAVVVGGGFGGILCAGRLRDAGLRDVRIIEKGAGFGGTWYWNQYPGAQCDIESYVYMPMLEQLGTMASEKYARAPEILEHANRLARHLRVDDSALLGTEVTEATWDENAKRWIVSTHRGDLLRARFLVLATGPLHKPKLPGVEGINTFKGVSFHTSRWDYDYTGGSSLGGLDKLAGLRVGIIGTGATAVQAVPHLGASAGHLYVFQRTPSSVDERGNSPTDPEWSSSLEPGWQWHRAINFNTTLNGIPQEIDLVNDGWTWIVRRMVDLYRSGDPIVEGKTLEEVLELANVEKMEELRTRISEVVTDPDVAEALKPYYALFCKRPTFNDDYLPTFNRPNVTLVDTNGKGIDRITERGVVANGVEYELDCIIYATGFEVGTDYERRADFVITGRAGETLTKKWDHDGIRTLHGMQTHDFPNCFIISQFQSGFTANYTHLLTEAADHMSFIVRHMKDNDLAVVEATQAAENEWAQEIVDNARNGTGGIGGTDCTPGYYNLEGQLSDKPPYGAWYGKGSVVFFQMMKEWRESGEFQGLEFAR